MLSRIRVAKISPLITTLRTPLPPSCPFFSLPNFSNIISSQNEYAGEKLIGYSQSQIYEVVANINDYQTFIPHCTRSTVLTQKHLSHSKKYLTAELGVGFKGFEETYVSEVTCDRPNLVQAVASPDSRLFQHLTSTWRFFPHANFPDTHCHLDYYLKFEFASPLHTQISNLFFDQVSQLMVKAFEERCGQIYGPPADLPED